MEPVGHHSENGPFTRPNDPQSRCFGDPEFRRHFRQKFTWTSVKTLAMKPVGHHGKNGPFTRPNEPGAGKPPPPILPIFVCYSPRDFMLVTMAKTAHLQGQTCPEAGKPPILSIFVSYKSNGFYGDSKFQRHFCHKFTWTSIKTIAMEPVGHHGQKGPFTRSNDPQSR
ncbi:hypothetical protein H5410_029310 [Solanum commersonii]|uniref:Uncharacterized protein n=1 Tax=Solanum commersonii TaxID=4109 RepID=A0A9J5Z591_SOLCO|nr:hypothetical protein H5410_029310 [Solanum commersonii]